MTDPLADCDPLFTLTCQTRDGLLVFGIDSLNFDPQVYFNSVELSMLGIEFQLDYRPSKYSRFFTGSTILSTTEERSESAAFVRQSKGGDTKGTR